jgi:hypothetical protein
MDRSDLNKYWAETLLYYCFIVDSSQRFDMYANNLGTWGYDENGNLIINFWMSQTIPQPSIQELLSYNTESVITFYKYYYVIPSDIRKNQPFEQLGNYELSNLNLDSDYIGCIIFNIDIKKIQYYDGTNWVSIY